MNSISWFLTNRCNLRCSYCFAGNKSQEDSTIEVGKALVDFLLKNSIEKRVSISFFGMEPMLRYDLVQEVVAYANTEAEKAGKRIGYNMTTNGTLLNDDKIKWLIDNKVGVLLSMDGLPHEENRRRFPDGSPSGNIVFQNALNLLGAGYTPTIRWTFTPETVKHMYVDSVKLARLGFRTLAIEPVYSAKWTDEALGEYQRELRKIAIFYREEARAGRRLTVKPIDDAIGLFRVETRQKGRCGTATGGVGVDIEGNIYPCHRYVTMGKPVIGNIFTGWNQKALSEVRCWDINKLHPQKGTCKDCPVQLRCPGGCLCENEEMCGSKYCAPESYCRMQRINQVVANELVQILYSDKNKILMSKLERPDLKT